MGLVVAPPPLDSITLSSSDFRANCFLRTMNIFETLAAVTGFVSSLVHVLVILFPWESKDEYGNMDRISYYPLLIMRIYGIMFGLVITFQESNYRFIFTYLVRANSIQFSVSHHILCRLVLSIARSKCFKIRGLAEGCWRYLPAVCY
jgi:hypothetical protein